MPARFTNEARHENIKFLYGIREMVSFELGREIEKDVFSSCHERGTMKNSESHEESNLRPSDSALRCSTAEPQNTLR